MKERRTPLVDKTRWRADAKIILEDLRVFQDAITEKHGYEGFSFASFSVCGIVEGKLVLLNFAASDEGTIVSLLDEEGTALDTITIKLKE